MTTTITDGVTTITPILTLGYTSTREARNILHDIIGSAGYDVTLRAAGHRAGRLAFLVSTLTDALALEAMHAQPVTLHLEDDEHPGLNMTYVTVGAIEVALDEESRARWVVTSGFQEVTS